MHDCLVLVTVLQVAQAPKSSAPQFQRISELELDQAWAPNQAARSTDINLSLLTSCLLPSAQVRRGAAACCLLQQVQNTSVHAGVTLAGCAHTCQQVQRMQPFVTNQSCQFVFLPIPFLQVVEPPEVWDYSLLFSQLKAELQNEAAAPADSSTNGANLQGKLFLKAHTCTA
jgi:hypothetical protein